MIERDKITNNEIITYLIFEKLTSKELWPYGLEPRAKTFGQSFKDYVIFISNEGQYFVFSTIEEMLDYFIYEKLSNMNIDLSEAEEIANWWDRKNYLKELKDNNYIMQVKDIKLNDCDIVENLSINWEKVIDFLDNKKI